MRDEAPVTSLSHLVPDSRLLDVCVKTNEETRRARRGHQGYRGGGDDKSESKGSNNGRSDPTVLNYCPTLTFENDSSGSQAAKTFAQHSLLPFLHKDLRKLARMVRVVPDFPRPGIEFRHVLNISQQPGGLALCASLLRTHFIGDWAKVDAVACCEAGGFVYAPALAALVGVPLVLIREAGKLPPPTVSIMKHRSHISSWTSNDSRERSIEMDRGLVHKGASVVVVDDVFATGRTLLAVLRLLGEAGVDAKDVGVMAVAEFPVHRGRELLRQRGFGAVNIQSLLVYGGA
ncbi:hypothetical protein MRS44_016954 [Fusarium solani]|uniref:adenine phosphoribosyltransferase n=1 Tax=Fusarium solani TaxID=169388 RepID=A0A9P9K8M1_FUSSL|nr:phosphoribosyltransferase-like protein [Fusarium solani]KAH7243989.1 phosphoribosyltransferase-like protein [Fusarium solani]KAJ3455472.1 hypothetical protein MRS44_016954 [Fusarium solani]